MISETSDCTEEEGYKVHNVKPDEIHANWPYILPLLRNLEPREWNGTYAKLLSGDCKLIAIELNGEVEVAVILTIGKHGGTDGFNTCFIDVLAASRKPHKLKVFNLLLEAIRDVARLHKCDGIITETPNKKLADIAARLGFKATPMYKLGRYV